MGPSDFMLEATVTKRHVIANISALIFLLYKRNVPQPRLLLAGTYSRYNVRYVERLMDGRVSPPDVLHKRRHIIGLPGTMKMR